MSSSAIKGMTAPHMCRLKTRPCTPSRSPLGWSPAARAAASHLGVRLPLGRSPSFVATHARGGGGRGGGGAPARGGFWGRAESIKSRPLETRYVTRDTRLATRDTSSHNRPSALYERLDSKPRVAYREVPDSSTSYSNVAYREVPAPPSFELSAPRCPKEECASAFRRLHAGLAADTWSNPRQLAVQPS